MKRLSTTALASALMMLAAVAIPMAIHAGSNDQFTIPPDPKDADEAITYDMRSGRMSEGPRLASRVGGSRLEYGQLGGDLYGTLFGMGEVEPVDDPAQWPARANVVVGRTGQTR